jgi:hypothetical protein
MSHPSQWIGIDVCQSHLDIAVYPFDASFRFPNDEAGRTQLIEQLSRLRRLITEGFHPAKI